MARVKVQVPIDETTQEGQLPASEQVTPPIEAETPMSQPPVQPMPRRLSKNQMIIGVLVLVVLIALFMLLNDRRHLKQEVNKLSTSQPATQQTDLQKYQDEIGKIVELPSGQPPSLIPVKDAKSLAADNSFFKNAQDGDVVLLYVLPDKSVQAILYRPNDHKVVEATSNATIGTGTTKPNSNKQ